MQWLKIKHVSFYNTFYSLFKKGHNHKLVDLINYFKQRTRIKPWDEFWNIVNDTDDVQEIPSKALSIPSQDKETKLACMTPIEIDSCSDSAAEEETKEVTGKKKVSFDSTNLS